MFTATFHFLIKCIRKAVAFAGNDELTIYINPTDEKKRSDLEGAPVLIWQVLSATARSAIVVSSVSPER